jgi:putative ABC transport system ATP-binding protein
MEIVVQTLNLTKIFNQGTSRIKASDNINISIYSRELVAILGKSGSGKTTLLNLIGGIEAPSSGKVLISGVDISTIKESQFTRFRGKNIGYVFQNYRLIDELNVQDNIRVVQYINNWDYDEKHEKRIIELLEIDNILKARPSQLSGGQQQRVAIARALIGKPSIVLADEPTGNLDNTKSKEIIGFFKELNSKLGQTFIIVTHDLDIADQCNRIITIEDGRIIKDIKNEKTEDFH